MKVPRTFLEFQEMFSDEGACWAHLRRVRWPHGFVCPRCGGHGSHRIRARRLDQCRRCRYQASLTAGTVFHKTRVPLRIWFLGVFFLARHKKGISALQFQRDTGLGSYQTAWTILHKLRSSLRARPESRLKGLVEVDETYLGPRRVRGQRGRGAQGKTTIVAAVEQRQHSAGAARLAVVDDITWPTLGGFIRGVIDDEAIVRTDGYRGYLPLASTGTTHERIVQGTAERSAEILPWAHTVFSNLKTWIRGTFHGVSPKHLQRYLEEFNYRFDRRWRETELFHFVLRRAVGGEPLPYARLTAEVIG